MDWIRKTGTGKIFAKSRDSKEEFLLNPSILREENNVRKSNFSNENDIQNFKLITCRRLVNYSQAQLEQLALATQQNLEKAALLSNQPVPFPVKLEVKDNQIYGLYIDEDIYPGEMPVYVFKSNTPIVNCFVEALATGKDDYFFSVCHSIDKEYLNDGNFKIKYRIFSFNKQKNTSFFIESSSLPNSFSINYDIRSISYLGGGCWSGLSIDNEDKIPVIGTIPFKDSTYKVTSLNGRKGIVAHSTTVSNSFTWCNGVLNLGYRTRDASEQLNTDILKETNVISVEKISNYSLPIYLRNLSNGHSAYFKEEISNSKAIYVGNTNLPVNSPFQSPDYGTDVGRYSIQEYDQQTNIIRPISVEPLANKDQCSFSYTFSFPVLASSFSRHLILFIDPGKAKGSIKHPYQTKLTFGKREYNHFYYYKYWWTHGKILSFEPYGDTNIYVRGRVDGLKYKVSTFQAKGDLILSEYPNAVYTTWESPPAASGFFRIEEGEFVFLITYLNPPLIGHQGCYYYHINPLGSNNKDIRPAVNAETTSVDYSAGFFGIGGSYATGSKDPRENQNTKMATYTQMLGGLAGTAVSSLDIGSVTIADKDTDSLSVRSPTESQRDLIAESPVIFPNGFFEAYSSINYDNTNNGIYLRYNGIGEIIESYSVK